MKKIIEQVEGEGFEALLGEVLQELCLARERMMLETKTGIKRE